MTAFCEPPMSMSMPQLSTSKCVVPRPVMASTTNSVSVPFSERGDGLHVVTRTGGGLGRLHVKHARALELRPDFAQVEGLPVRRVTSSIWQAKALARSRQRSPNFPAVSTDTFRREK